MSFLRRRLFVTGLLAGLVMFMPIGIVIALQEKPQLLLDWNSVYVTEQGLLSINPWHVDLNRSRIGPPYLVLFPKQIFLGKELPANIELWVEAPTKDGKQNVITLGELRSLIYTRARAGARKKSEP